MTNTNKKISYDGTQISTYRVDFSQVDNRAGQDDVAIQYDLDESRIGGHLKVVVRHEIPAHLQSWEEVEKLEENIKFTALMVAQRRLAEMTVSNVDSIFYFENIKLEHDTFADAPITEMQDLNWTLSGYLQKDGSGSNMEVLLVNYEPRTVKGHETYIAKGGRHSNRRAGLVHENVAQEFMQKGYCNIPAGIGWSELVQAHPSDLGNAQLFGPQVELPSILPLTSEE